MSGIKVIRTLLGAAAGLTALVPLTRVIAGVIPQGTAMPAIALTDVVGIDNNILAPGANHHVTDRVQVTVVAATYPEVKAVMTQVRKACRDQTGTIAGISGVDVHTEAKGPDFNFAESGLYAQTQDFRIGFTEAA